MKKLIICEKGTMAEEIAKILGCRRIDNLNFENNNYVVTKLSGHIIALKELKDYDAIKGLANSETGKTKWSDIKLPFVPDKFEYVAKKSTKELFENVKRLINREDIDVIYNCGDPDNEGQVLGEMPIRLSKTKKKVKRLFLTAVNETYLREELKKDLDNDIPKYRGMFNAGMTRGKIDWIYGMNYTVYTSVKSGTLMQVGRLKVPIIEYIYNRDMEIENFVPEKYYGVSSETEVNGETINLTSKKTFSKEKLEEAKLYAGELNKQKAKVISIKTKKVTKVRPVLFNAIGLHKFASKNLKMKPNAIEEIMQKMYLEGYISYPRSESQLIAEENMPAIQEIINKINNGKDNLEIRKNNFGNAEKIIAGHDAIIITKKFPEKEKMSETERALYEIIYNRFCAAFCKEECIVDETTLSIQAGEETFNKKGNVIVQEGFTKYEKISVNNNLPKLSEGQEFDINFQPVEKMTTPPKKVDYDELTNYLSFPFKKSNDKEFTGNELMTKEEYEAIAKGMKLGTPATTTPTITECIKSGYFSENKGNTYSITELGKTYVENINALNINLKPERTAEINVLLQKIENNELDPNILIEQVKNELLELLKSNTERKIEVKKYNNQKEFCKYNNQSVFKRKTKEGKTFYVTDDNSLFLFENSFIYGKQFTLSEKEVKSLFSGKSIELLLHSKKENKDFEGLIGLDGVDEKKYVKFKLTGYSKKKNNKKEKKSE